MTVHGLPDNVGYRTPRDVSISLLSVALPSVTSLRWRQLSHTGPSFDEWALDDIVVTGNVNVGISPSYIISEDFYPTPSFP